MSLKRKKVFSFTTGCYENPARNGPFPVNTRGFHPMRSGSLCRVGRARITLMVTSSLHEEDTEDFSSTCTKSPPAENSPRSGGRKKVRSGPMSRLCSPSGSNPTTSSCSLVPIWNECWYAKFQPRFEQAGPRRGTRPDQSAGTRAPRTSLAGSLHRHLPETGALRR